MDDAIVVQDLHKRYKDNYAVRGVSFTVKKGEIFGIVGPNGAGKTTTIEIMEGLRTRDQGKVQVLGLDPEENPWNCDNGLGCSFSLLPFTKGLKYLRPFNCSALFTNKGDL
ncbi:ABC-type multidrug transport system ATPase subunit [Caldalkalibacillus uzonensis]|uniref:ABC-type multidrug transport system ATPase subunit n=1 Tax=Caldalkalibacillus uzonensis TaxID=353224 RepID=A0ABU0CRD8_9BACI|nr:ATP-binding cassette domain-containing protein [Caldalkalibacillus uzonensis]MDQ0338434.1 ABC-type multidrug transport system ATPase subunit [Caldalkalibacillus uzonensis]